MYDTLESREIELAHATIALYSSINKMKQLGLSFDSNRLSYLDVERVWLVHSSIDKVNKTRQKAKGSHGKHRHSR